MRILGALESSHTNIHSLVKPKGDVFICEIHTHCTCIKHVLYLFQVLEVFENIVQDVGCTLEPEACVIPRSFCIFHHLQIITSTLCFDQLWWTHFWSAEAVSGPWWPVHPKNQTERRYFKDIIMLCQYKVIEIYCWHRHVSGEIMFG